MRIEVRRAEAELMNAVRTLVDDVFVRPRRLSPSLATRYPDILADERARNVFVACLGRRVVGTAAVRPIVWRSDGDEGRAVAVGLVATDPDHRGRGIASVVLQTVAEAVAAEGASAAVLWTAQAAFYQRLGWETLDPGMLGASPGACAAREPPPAETLGGRVVASVATLRDRYASVPFERAPETWSVVPKPADAVSLYRFGEAYALLGRAADGRGYLYELVGEESGFPALWAAIHRDSSTVFVNDAPGTTSFRWLSQKGAVDWKPKPLAMWLKLDERARLVAGLYVPYLDRI
jgi:predicted N-acetyltransferase YhbS